MKLSQFKFKLPEEQIALYPHHVVHEYENENGEKRDIIFISDDGIQYISIPSGTVQTRGIYGFVK